MASLALQRFLEQKALQEVILLFLDASGRSLSKLTFIVQVCTPHISVRWLHLPWHNMQQQQPQHALHAWCVVECTTRFISRKPFRYTQAELNAVQCGLSLAAVKPTCLQGLQDTAAITSQQVEQLEAAWASALLKLQFIDNLVPPLPPGEAARIPRNLQCRTAVMCVCHATAAVQLVQMPQPSCAACPPALPAAHQFPGTTPLVTTMLAQRSCAGPASGWTSPNMPQHCLLLASCCRLQF
jgi:hypothetical protein